MIKACVSYLKRNFHRGCYVHLVVSTFSFIILMYWGIPFCLLGFLGNVIFNPILALFLCLSTVLFFTEILLIPNGLIVLALDYLSNGWLYVLSLHKDLSLEIPCAQPSFYITGMLVSGTFAIMLMHASYLKKNMLLSILLAVGFVLSQQKVIKHCSENLPCAQDSIPIIKHGNNLIVIDPGCLGRYLSAPSYVEHTLVPHIIQKFGTLTVDHLILLKPGKLLFDAVQMLLQRIKVKHIYLPLWKGTLSKSGLFSFMRMKENAASRNTTLHRITQQELPLISDDDGSLIIKNLNTQIQKSSIQFNAFCICHTIDKQTVTFYPSQYKQSTI